MPDTTNDPRFDLLPLIADENLGIETLEPTGKPTVDLRLVSVNISPEPFKRPTKRG